MSLTKISIDTLHTISADDWRRSIALGRERENKMKLLLGLLLIGTARLHASHDLLFLDALAAVESGYNDNAVGPCGSVSRYQLKPSTWRQHCDWPIEDARVPTKAQIVALRHLKWLKKTMGTEVYWTLACGWKFGASYDQSKETNKQMLARIDYVNRVMALFDEARKARE